MPATIKQKIAFREVLKGSTITKAMVKAKYSKSTSTTTGKLTNTKGWKELMDKFISDEKLARVHNEGLSATKYESVLIGKGESEIQEVPDFAVRHKYLESGYKIKGKMKDPETSLPPQTVIIVNYGNRNNPPLSVPTEGISDTAS